MRLNIICKKKDNYNILLILYQKVFQLYYKESLQVYRKIFFNMLKIVSKCILNRNSLFKGMLEYQRNVISYFSNHFVFLIQNKKILLQNKRKNANTFRKVQIGIKIPREL